MSGGTRHLFRDGFIGIGDPMFGVASRHERASALGIFGSVIGVAAVAGQILGAPSFPGFMARREALLRRVGAWLENSAHGKKADVG